jgi:crossover junction endodeoxyribonuclease RuvC
MPNKETSQTKISKKDSNLSETNVFVGLDLSLANTGVAILGKDGKVLYCDLVKSKPSGDLPIDELLRLLTIRKTIEELIFRVAPDSIPLVLIENMAFGVRKTSALTQLSGLNYFIREMCLGNDWPFCLIFPTSLKKFVAQVGNAHKDIMILETYKRWGVSLLNENLADAYGLAQVGRALLCSEIELTHPQQEVTTIIKKQL